MASLIVLHTVATQPAAADGKPGTFRVVAYNVYECTGWPKDRARAHAATAKGQMPARFAQELELYDPDLINFSESPREEVVADIARRLKMNYVFLPSGGKWPGAILTRCEIVASRKATELGAVRIPAGSALALLLGAADRDPRRFPDPASFRGDRPNAREHIAFGRGVHSCPGAPLVRSEARITLERFLDRMADIRIAEAQHGPSGRRRYDYTPSYILRGVEALHLEFSPAG